jgi:hypothetical protein
VNGREPDPDAEIEAQTRQLAAGCLADLADSLGACVLKVLLEDGLSNELRVRHNADRYRARLAPELLPDYFPRPFVVTDACVTNAPRIWLGKHLDL